MLKKVNLTECTVNLNLKKRGWGENAMWFWTHMALLVTKLGDVPSWMEELLPKGPLWT